MTNAELENIRALIDSVMYASTKKDAQPSLRRLEFIASSMKGKVDSYLSGKLSEAVSYAKEASGRVKNQEYRISCADQSWYVFENGVSDDPQN